MKVMDRYKDVFTTDKTYIFLKSGRVAGKSKAGAQLITQYLFERDGDIFVGRAYGSDIQQSIMAEIINVVEELGMMSAIETRTRPLKIINKLNGNKIHFMGIGGADVHRTKGYVPDKPYWSLIAFDELQQLTKQENLDEAMDTFLRHLDPEGKVLYMFNPDRRASHWCNEYFRLKEYDDEFLCIYSNYKYIAKVLNTHTLRKIEVTKETNPSEYKHRYLGETEGLFGAVYASFIRDQHLIEKDFAKQLLKKIGLAHFIIGVDPASTKDATALVPILLMRNGQVIVADYFYHDPKQNGVVTNDRITPLIQQWLEDLSKDWKIPYNQPIHMLFDSNAVSQDLMYTLQYRLPSNVEVQTYSQKRIIEMADIMKSAFSRNLLFISDSGGYYNYVTKRFIRGSNPLVTQLETVVWNEAGDGFENKVPNDATDALTYGVAHYLRNKGNMYYPEPRHFYKPLNTKEVDDVNS